MFCDDCGAKLQEGMKFCEHCGAPIGGVASVQKPVQPVQPVFPQQPYQQSLTYVQPVKVVTNAQVYPTQKNPGVAILLNFLVVGMGLIYAGNAKKAIPFMISYYVLIVANILSFWYIWIAGWFIFSFLAFGVMIWSQVVGYQAVIDYNRKLAQGQIR